MRRQDHGRDDYRDYINNLAYQYLVWPTITLGVHIYTWILSMIYGIYMDSDGTKGGALENGNILCYLTGQATQGIKLTCFCTYTCGEDMCRNFYRPRHAWGHMRVRLKVWVQHDKTEEGMFDGFQPAWVRDEYNIRNIRWPVHMYFTRMRRLRK